MATHDEEMEATWGQAATYTEYRVNDRIRYTTKGHTNTGTIVWICAADQSLPMRYIVEPDYREGQTEIIHPCNILINDKHEPTEHLTGNAVISEPMLTQLLADLSLPLIISTDTDDDGQPYYIWQVGTPQPGHPWGLYVGTHRQYLGAVKLALERAFQHLQEHNGS